MAMIAEFWWPDARAAAIIVSKAIIQAELHGSVGRWKHVKVVEVDGAGRPKLAPPISVKKAGNIDIQS